MAAKIKAQMDAVTAVQIQGGTTPSTYRDALLIAMCTGILEEITSNSELVPISSDTGTAGAGIITGKVK
jgi:hypothetical protein